MIRSTLTRLRNIPLRFLLIVLLVASCKNNSEDAEDHPHRHGAGHRGGGQEAVVEESGNPTPAPSQF